MNQNRNNNTGQIKTVQNTHTPRPQNKDDIDSRSNEEWDTKGDNVTHNKKEHKSDRKNVKNE